MRDLTLTVVPADSDALSCASSKIFDGHRCDYDSPSQEEDRRASSGGARLSPYVTIGGELIILSDVFSHEAVKVEAKLRRGVPKDKRRFKVKCRARLIEHLSRIPVRFGKSGEFVSGKPAWVARSLSCKILKD